MKGFFFLIFFLGVPVSIEPVIKMLGLVHLKLHETLCKKDQFLLVHCSAGCGRTGSIIAIDFCWNLMKSGQLSCDFSLFKIGKMLREQRTSMIETFVCFYFFFFYIFIVFFFFFYITQ